ncbi:phosphoribosylamine--glycine ligase [Fusibacter sp. JL298sf-3]
MKILVVGGGGREHAIAWKLAQSPKKPELFAAPGNAGIASIAQCVPLAATDIEGLKAFALEENIDLTVVGPEQPLVDGLVDAFEAAGLRVFGPNGEAARFEGSKDFTKAFLLRHGIPTADYKTYTDVTSALAEVGQFGYPVVVKADGLAAGKGVVIAADEREAVEALETMMRGRAFGAAGTTVVLERFLTGTEASVLCFCDGETIVPMVPAQDYKKAQDGDAGLNTGGMGTYCPSRIIDDAMMARIQREILDPFVTGIKADGMAFKGVLFVGLMIDSDIRVLEYNVRFGDPETEVVLPRLKNDLIDVFEATIDGRLHEVTLQWDAQSTVCVILASGGYPEHYEKGFVIKGLDAVSDATVFHCGTVLNGDAVVTNGGRVLGVTAQAPTLEMARAKAYEAAEKIQFEGKYNRSDIAL